MRGMVNLDLRIKFAGDETEYMQGLTAPPGKCNTCFEPLEGFITIIGQGQNCCDPCIRLALADKETKDRRLAELVEGDGGHAE